MKWLIVGIALTLGRAASAVERCEEDCAEVVRQCSATCKKALKKDTPAQINSCEDKCKEFANECRKDCKGDKK